MIGQAVHIQCKMGVRFPNHCCRSKYYIFAVCVYSLGYPARKVHALYCVVICGLFACTIFFHIIPQKLGFSEIEEFSDTL